MLWHTRILMPELVSVAGPSGTRAGGTKRAMKGKAGKGRDRDRDERHIGNDFCYLDH